MKVYIPIQDFPYEGYGEPEVAFTTLEKAQVWAEAYKKAYWGTYLYEIFELEVE